MSGREQTKVARINTFARRPIRSRSQTKYESEPREREKIKSHESACLGRWPIRSQPHKNMNSSPNQSTNQSTRQRMKQRKHETKHESKVRKKTIKQTKSKPRFFRRAPRCVPRGFARPRTAPARHRHSTPRPLCCRYLGHLERRRRHRLGRRMPWRRMPWSVSRRWRPRAAMRRTRRRTRRRRRRTRDDVALRRAD